MIRRLGPESMRRRFATLRNGFGGRGDSSAAVGTPAPSLTTEEEAFWTANGYLVLPEFFSNEEIAGLGAELDALWENRSIDDHGLVIDIFINTPDERRVKFGVAPSSARTSPYKLNDTYLVSPVFRDVMLDRRLVGKLTGLLDGAPIVCNSLTFEYGSQQRFHFDTFYMPPSVPNKMLATWIALEDCSPAAGPLRYYPGSHKLTPYRFSDGRLNARVEEMGEFDEYIEKQIADAGLQWESFAARAGDVFIWHAQLYHGGAPIDDMMLTRRSLVTHYFRAEDVAPEVVEDIGGGRFILRRAHQATD